MFLAMFSRMPTQLIRMPLLPAKPFGLLLGILISFVSFSLIGSSEAIAAVSTSESTYSWFDATTILLREGMEAILVITALLAVLTQTGQANKQIWIWMGTAAGIFASIATAIALQSVFDALTTKANQELIEGITALIAAVLLLYVSYWLHSRSATQDWQRYLQTSATTALNSNRLLSLAILAFLAVYREGAETVLFLIGIAPAIQTSNLLAGLGIGTGLLIVLASLMVGLGVRIPIRPFFLISSLLIYGLGFRFVGKGIHALQVAQILPVHTTDFLPTFKALGLYPTWETMGLQLLVMGIGVSILLRRQISSASQ